MAKITGQSDIVATRTDNGKWKLSMDTSLHMKMHLLRYLPLPPGFSSIGSFVMSFQCQDRARKSLESLKQAYLTWAATAVEVDDEQNDAAA